MAKLRGMSIAIVAPFRQQAVPELQKKEEEKREESDFENPMERSDDPHDRDPHLKAPPAHGQPSHAPRTDAGTLGAAVSSERIYEPDFESPMERSVAVSSEGIYLNDSSALPPAASTATK